MKKNSLPLLKQSIADVLNRYGRKVPLRSIPVLLLSAIGFTAAAQTIDFAGKIDLPGGAASTYSIALGDVDGDGKIDMVVADVAASQVSVYRNTSSTGSLSTSSFSTHVDFPASASTRCIALGDYDGDGKLDIAATNSGSNTICVLRNTSTAGSITSTSFAAKVDYVVGFNPEGIATADIDGDGKLDLVCANSGPSRNMSVLRNQTTGAGAFTPTSFSGAVNFAGLGGRPVAITTGDLNGDGKPEIVVANQSGAGQVHIFINNSTSGSLSLSQTNITVNENPFAVKIADMDGDGKKDLIINNNIYVSVLRNTSTSSTISFAARQDFNALGPSGLDVADLNGDGKPDIVCSSYPSTVSIFRNTSTIGSVSLGTRADLAGGAYPISLAIADLDGDGQKEIAVANAEANTISIFRNATIKTALRFDGINDRINGVNGALPQGSSDRTVEAWIKLDNLTGTKTIFNWGIIAGNLRSGLMVSGDHLYYVGQSNDYNATASILSANVWTHVAFTLMGTTVKFYINGVLTETGTLAGAAGTAGTQWSIANRTNSVPIAESFAGSIDEVRVWNTVRTAAELLANKDCDVSPQTGLVGYYRFDEGTVEGNNTAITQVKDLSGSGSCGNIVNMDRSGTTSNFVLGAIGSCSSALVTPGAITGTLSVTTGQTTALGNAASGGVWASSNTAVAAVNGSTGIVTGVSAGTAVITYTAFCTAVTATVVVTPSTWINVAGTAPDVAANWTDNGLAIGAGGAVSATNFTTSGNTFNLNNAPATTTTSWTIGNGVALNVNYAGTATMGGNLVINTTATLNIAASATLHLSGITLSGAGTVVNNGTLRCTGTEAFSSPLPDGRSWGGTVVYDAPVYGAGVASGTYNNLTVGSAETPNNGYIATGDLIINGALSLSVAGDYLAMLGTNLSGTLISITGPGDIVVQNNGSPTQVPAGKTWPGTFSYNGGMTGTQTIAAGTYNNLQIANTGIAHVLGGNVTVTGYLGMQNPANLTIGSNTLTINTIFGTATTYLIGSAASNLVLNTSSTAQLFFSQATPGTSNMLNSLTINSGSVTLAASSPVTVNTLGLNGGTLNDGGNTITVAGNVTGSGTHTGSGAVMVSASSAATVSGATFGNLILVNAANCSLTGNPVVNGLLKLTTGVLNIANNDLTFGAAASFAGTPSVTNMIYTAGTGTVRKMMTAAGSFTWPIGSSTSAYTPLTLSFTSGTFAPGAYTSVRVVPAKEPHNANTTNYLNRYWAVAMSGITSPAYKVTNAGYLASDVTGAETSLTLGAYTALPWDRIASSEVNTSTHSLSAFGEINATSANFTGINSSFPSVHITSPAGTSVLGGTTITLQATGAGDPALTYKWMPAEVLSASTGTMVTTTPTATATTTMSYTVTVTDGNGLTSGDIYTITVIPPLPAITGSLIVCAGATSSLSNAVGGGTWTTSSPAIATVNASGVVTGVSSGTAKISYSAAAGLAVATVTVNTAPGAITAAGGGIITTIAGTGVMGFSGDNGPATAASINVRPNVAVDASGNIYFSESLNNRVRKINTAGIITTIAGTGAATYNGDGIAATSANLNFPAGITIDAAGNVIVVESVGRRVRRINTTTGLISTVAGNGSDGTPVDGGAATAANLSQPWAVVTDAANNIYISDIAYHLVRKISPSGIISKVAGRNIAAYLGDGGPATAAYLSAPMGLAADAAGNLYIADRDNYAIRKITTAGIITTCAGNGLPGTNGDGGPATAARLFGVTDVELDAAGNMYVADQSNSKVRKIDLSGIITTVAGGGTSTPGNGGPATAAGMSGMLGIALNASGELIICELTRLRKVSAGSGSASLCVGSTTTLSNSVPGGIWSASNGNASVGASTGIVTGIAPGICVISYSLPSGCYSTTTVSVNGVSVSAASTTLCSGASTTLTATGTTTYSWSPGAGLTVTTGASITAAPTSTTTYTVTGTGSGCTTTATVTVSVNAIPAITGPASVCIGESIALGHITEGGAWSSSSNAAATVNSSGIVTGVAAGTVNIYYQVAEGCITSRSIVVNAPPAAITGTANVCAGSTTTLANTGAGTWSSSNAEVATVPATPGVVTGMAAGNATITFRQSSTGCYTTRIVTVNALPDSISGSSNLCIGNTVTFTSAPGGGTWSAGPGSAASINLTSGVATGNSAGTIVIYYTSAGCVTAKTVTVSATPSPITGTATVCIGSSTTLASATTGQAWSSENTDVATVSATGVVTGVAPGTTTVSYANAAGCSRTAIVTVTSGPAEITGPGVVCLGGAINLASATPGGTWTSAAAYATVSSSGIVTGAAIGTATISYRTTATCFTTKTVTVTSAPADPITGSAKVCIGTTTTLNHTVADGTWSNNTPAKAIVSPTGVVTGVATGTSTISYFTDAGCYRTVVVTVNAFPNAIGGTGVVCEGLTTTLTNSTPGGSWVNNGAIATIGSSSGIVTGVDAGTSLVSYVVTATGCASTKIVTVNARPAAIIGSSGICIGSTDSFSTTPSGGTWTSSATGKASVGMATGVVAGVAAGTANIIYTLPTGCANSKVVNVNALPGTFSGTLTVCAGNTTTLTATTASLTWSSGNASVATVATGTTITGIVTAVAPGTAVISYSNGAGCARTAIVTVTASPAAIMGNDEICVGGSTLLTSATGSGTWSSSSTAKATIVQNTGLVTGVAAGLSTITYKLNANCYATRQVTVVTAPSLGITGPAGVCIGSDALFTHPTSGGTWSSSNTSKATVNTATGMVAGVTAGTATITYHTGPGCYRTIGITIYPPAMPVSGTPTVCVGATTDLSNAGGGGSWSSADDAIATITPAYGVVTGMAEGNVTVTYTIASTGCYSFRTISVLPVPDAITGSGTVCANAVTTLSSAPSGGTWATGAGIYATVNASTGEVTGVASSTVNITYTRTNGCIAVKQMTVNSQPGNITGTAVVNELSSVTLGNATPGGTWSSANPGIATIAAGTGVLTGVTTGNTTVTYQLTATGCFRTRVVTVNPFGSRPAIATATGAAAPSVSIYPSPTSGTLTIEAPGKGLFTILTMDGRTIETYEATGTTTITLPAHLAAGVYMCRYEGADGSFIVSKIVYTP